MVLGLRQGQVMRHSILLRMKETPRPFSVWAMMARGPLALPFQASSRAFKSCPSISSVGIPKERNFFFKSSNPATSFVVPKPWRPFQSSRPSPSRTPIRGARQRGAPPNWTLPPTRRPMSGKKPFPASFGVFSPGRVRRRGEIHGPDCRGQGWFPSTQSGGGCPLNLVCSLWKSFKSSSSQASHGPEGNVKGACGVPFGKNEEVVFFQYFVI